MTVEEAIVFARKLTDRRLNKIQEIIFRQSWEGQSYAGIASNYGYDHGYIKDAGSKLWQILSEAFELKITKKNFKSVLKQHWRGLLAKAQQAVAPTKAGADANERQDWGDAIDVELFYDRSAELSTLEQWLVEDHCRLVVLLGMGGIGKTALSVKLAQQIQHEFDYLIWRNLRNAPPVQDLLAELLKFLAPQQGIALAETIDGRVTQLLGYLRSARCLLVLDNAESILCEGERTGCYRQGYAGYGQLLRCVGETAHQSAVVLTSREKPIALATKEGEKLGVRTLQVTGLPTAAVREILQAKAELWGSESDWHQLTEHYGGNPLALKMVAPAIHGFFDSNISQFLGVLRQGPLVLCDVRNLLEPQFNRLSDIEKNVMHWLAISHQPAAFSELQADFGLNIRQSKIIEVLASLQRRSLITQSPLGFTQQPMLIEYVIEMINQVDEDIAISPL